MAIKFSAGPHYLSAASQLLTCNPVERLEASLPLGLCVSWLTGAGICDHAEAGARPSGSSPHSWNTWLSGVQRLTLLWHSAMTVFFCLLFFFFILVSRAEEDYAIQTSSFCRISYYGIKSIRAIHPSIHPSALLFILFRSWGAGREAGYRLDKSSIHHKANTHKQTNAFTFTPKSYLLFPIHLSCKSLDIKGNWITCRKSCRHKKNMQTPYRNNKCK